MVKEFTVECAGERGTRRPDIVLFVNGIPFCVIECKGPNEDFEQAISQSIRNQASDEIPHLFRTVQLLIASNRNQAKYATVGTGAKFWSIWREKEIADDEIAKLVRAPLEVEETRGTFADGFEEERAPFEYLMEGGRELRRVS